jgi:hypothetical protein
MSVLFAGCQSKDFNVQTPTVDTSPVDCDYKWFQSATSPKLQRSCALPRDETLKVSQEDTAIQRAWEIAEQRCPEVCPPRELRDTSAPENPFPNGRCRDDRVHYTVRVFFQCTAEVR